MNTETGAIYEGAKAVLDALGRGEPVVEVSAHVAKTMRAGQRVEAKAKAKRKRKQARSDRKHRR